MFIEAGVLPEKECYQSVSPKMPPIERDIMSPRWPFKPWPRNRRLRNMINVLVVGAGVVEIITIVVGRSMLWLSITIPSVLWLALMIGLLIERPQRNRSG